MNKSDAKQIREIAARLPIVVETHASGGHYEKVAANGGGGDFKDKFVPNVYKVPVNHERRLRKAYEAGGMSGVTKYLESIHELQKKSHAKKVKN